MPAKRPLEERRYESIQLRLRKSEYDIIADFAKKEKISVTHAVRGLVFTGMIMQGEPAAIAWVAKLWKEEFEEKLGGSFLELKKRAMMVAE